MPTVLNSLLCQWTNDALTSLLTVTPHFHHLAPTRVPLFFSMIAKRFPEIAQLPDEDKLTLIAELWQDVTDDTAEDNPALAAQKEQRWQEYQEHPERVSSWRQVKARILDSSK